MIMVFKKGGSWQYVGRDWVEARDQKQSDWGPMARDKITDE